MFRNKLRMRPLLVTVSEWFGHTRAGEHNFRNMCEVSESDSLVFKQNPVAMRDMVRTAFFDAGCPTWPIDAAIYAFPLRIAKALGIELIVYGEDIAATYGGPNAEEKASAAQQISNDVVKPFGDDWWLERGHGKLPAMLRYPSPAEVATLEPIYLSYFIPWSGYNNAVTAYRMGFRDCEQEWQRGGCVENYDQIDSCGYMVHPWLKFPKYGHARATDVCSNWIRDGLISRDKAVDLVLEHDHVLDTRALDDFLAFTGISHRQFWARVDDLFNRDLFTKTSTGWALKQPVTKLSIPGGGQGMY
jgi:hypothetical protein